MSTCAHDLRYRVGGESYLDSNIITLSLRFWCERCGASFRALGVPSGITADAPGAADGGEVTVFPLVPIGEEPQMAGVGRC